MYCSQPSFYIQSSVATTDFKIACSTKSAVILVVPGTIALHLSCFLNGLRWHLSGPSELPLKQRLLLLPATIFPFDHFMLHKSLIFLIFALWALWAFFRYHARACCRRASTAVLQYRKHSTSQRYQPAQSREASTCRPECDNASKQAEHLLCCSTASTAQHSTAQHSTAQHNTAQRNWPAKSRQASTHRSDCDNASKQSWRKPAYRGVAFSPIQLPTSLFFASCTSLNVAVFRGLEVVCRATRINTKNELRTCMPSIYRSYPSERLKSGKGAPGYGGGSSGGEV